MKIGTIVNYTLENGEIRPAMVTRVYRESGKPKSKDHQAAHDGVDLEVFGLPEKKFVHLALPGEEPGQWFEDPQPELPKQRKAKAPKAETTGAAPVNA